MNLTKLYQILGETTEQLRQGKVVDGTPELVAAINEGREELPGGVVSIDMMPHQSEIAPNMVPVDLHFLIIGVDRAKAEARKADLIAILNDWPDPAELAGGPSYISTGATIGDQGAVFQLYALGEVLGLWKIITPKNFGMTGAEADRAAGSGFIMITGYRPKP